LRLYEAQSDVSNDRDWVARGTAGDEIDRVHARSRFRSLSDPERFALYSMQGVEPSPFSSSASTGSAAHGHHTLAAGGHHTSAADGHHTLTVVREFRRVPFAASTLALTLFTARPGFAAPSVAALADFTVRAVSLYQPAYVLLAHSLESPGTIVLLTGVQDCAALQAASASAFSIERLLPELTPMLMDEPEVFVYCPDRTLSDEVAAVVSRHAV
jgi:hypothetical protein